jgi:type II secretory pathway component PulL
MDAWWWLPIGLAAWFAVSLVVGLLLGPFLKSCSQAWETQAEPTADQDNRSARHRPCAA